MACSYIGTCEACGLCDRTLSEISVEQMREYNEERPHDTLDGVPPTSFLVRVTDRNSPSI